MNTHGRNLNISSSKIVLILVLLLQITCSLSSTAQHQQKPNIIIRSLTTISEKLKKEGHATAANGKWDLGSEPTYPEHHLEEFADRWENRYPRVVKSWKENIDHLLKFTDDPEPIWVFYTTGRSPLNAGSA